jgi:hypothetical protein
MGTTTLVAFSSSHTLIFEKMIHQTMSEIAEFGPKKTLLV